MVDDVTPSDDSTDAKAGAPDGVEPVEFNRLCRDVNRRFRSAAEVKLEAGDDMLDTLFGGDAKLALSPAGQSHPAWVRFRKHTGARKVVPDRRRVSEALKLACWGRLVEGGFFTHLEITHREALLPLNDAKEIGEGAQKAVELNWGVRQIRKYVRERRAELAAQSGEPQQQPTPAEAVRAAIAPARRMAKSLSTQRARRLVVRGLGQLDDAVRERYVRDLTRAAEAFDALIRMLKDG